MWKPKIRTASSAAATVVLAALSSALINELHGGWIWWLLTGIVVIISAALAISTAMRGNQDGASGATGPSQVNIASGSQFVVQNGNQVVHGSAPAGPAGETMPH
ncbi:hypothetical protein ACWEF6_06805 [Amycolatopsis sp. NPDC004772]